MRNLRPGRVLEGTLLGVALLLFAVWSGGWVDHQPGLRALVRPRGAGSRAGS